jgi:tRNA A-37 threonylcarbamoyl transferase component Bud32
MAVFASFLFNRTLKQFLACKDLNSREGKALTEKVRSHAADALEKILEVIPSTPKPHSDVLKQICQEQVNKGSENRFLDFLDKDETTVRLASKNILGRSQQINPVKLFKRLHEGTSQSTSEIIDILEMQKTSLAPELFVKNALRLNGHDSGRLIDIAHSEAARTDMSTLSIEAEQIASPEVKIKLMRFLSAVDQPEAAGAIMQFLSDPSKVIVIEALKNLSALSVAFNPSPLVAKIPEMREDDRRIALRILHEKMTGQYLAALAPLLAGKDDALRTEASEIVAIHVSEKALERLLISLDKGEWWGRDEAIKTLMKHGSESLYKAAAALQNHDNEFVRSSAERLSMSQSSMTGDITSIEQAMLNENWQVREAAIQTASGSGSRSVLDIFPRVIEKYPESSVAVLKAVRKLGYSKGLEIASRCIQMKEATIQREALLTFNALVTQNHAEKVRDGIIKLVPRLQATVRDTALEVVNSITEQFNLSKLNIDEDRIFETRLTKIEEHSRHSKSHETTEIEKTEVVTFQNIEDLKVGDLWMDRYNIVREVGRGAMGRVMLVVDETVGEQLILKYMHPELTADPKARERFLRELKYSRKISHPNVIRIHDFLVKDGISAISMEYFESRGLDYLIKHELLGPHEASLKILYQVADGMWEAHRQNVIHRDLKPSNVLVSESGVAKVVDFGIASVSSEHEMTLTKTGMIIGTPAYLSPERARGEEADFRSDIYALGIIAYNMFNYGLPYRGEPMSLLFQHIEGKATPLHQLEKGISTEIGTLVARMMAADINKRYQSMDEVRQAIGQLL